MTTQTLKGFRDFLPDSMAIRNKVINTLKGVFESYGFSELQTPTLEYADVLLGKYGEEAEKLMYIFEDQGKRQVGLKYDLTVPLARVMAQYPDLPKPFKRYAIQPVFRADKPQKGRYREVYQCDVDIVGTNSPLADAEIAAIISDSFTILKFSDFTIRVNSRQILFDLIIRSGIGSDKSLAVLQSIDKLDKKSPEEVKQELSDKSLSLTQISDLFSAIESSQPDENLQAIINLTEKMGVTNIQFDPTLVRGLDYYTGVIYESTVTTPKIGSLSGGGRYDQLISTLGGPDLPAVGTTIGLDRLCDTIIENNLWSDLPTSPAKILVTIFSQELKDKSIELSTKLRQAGVPCELYPDSQTKLERQLKYTAAKGIPYVAIIGPEEAAQNLVKLKTMSTGRQTLISQNDIQSSLP